MKKVLFLVFTLICGVGFIAPVSAITLEEYNSLDNKGEKIIFPNKVTTAGTTFTIPSSITNYTLSHQWIEISQENYENYKKLDSQIATANKEYEDFINNTSNADKEKPEYAASLAEKKANIDTLQNQKLALITKYDDTKWKETTDNKVHLPSSAEYILWAKLVESDGTTTYAVKLVTDTEIITESTTVKDTEETLTEETTQTTTNPNTGISDYANYLIPVALVAGTALVFRKNKRFN